MNKAKKTYLKWEMKKLLPLYICSVLYVLFICAMLFAQLGSYTSGVLCTFGSPQYFSSFEVGDVFIYLLLNGMGDVHPFYVIMFSILLIILNFRYQNRSGISDFLRVLPIRESDKTKMKLCAGESVILSFSLLFGLCTTFVNALFNQQIIMAGRMFIQDCFVTNSYVVIWKMALMLFLSMSAIYLVLFAVQYYIHSMPVALGIGTGILLIPKYAVTLYMLLTRSTTGYYTTGSTLFFLFPVPDIVHTSSDMGYENISYVQTVWNDFSYKSIISAAMIIIALAATVLCLKMKWNIRESANSFINSEGVTRFFIAGISICAGTAIAYFTDDVSYYNGYFLIRYMLLSFVASVIVYLALHALLHIVMRARRDV